MCSVLSFCHIPDDFKFYKSKGRVNYCHIMPSICQSVCRSFTYFITSKISWTDCDKTWMQQTSFTRFAFSRPIHLQKWFILASHLLTNCGSSLQTCPCFSEKFYRKMQDSSHLIYIIIYVGGSKRSETNPILENWFILSDPIIIPLIEASVPDKMNASPWLADDVITYQS